MASQAKTSESEKDKFRAYLEKNRVIDKLTEVFVSLYGEVDKPINPLEYIKRNLGDPEEKDQDNLKNENLKLKQENEKLKKQIVELQKENEALRGDNSN